MPAALAPGLLLAGRYEIVSALGGTEFGAVYSVTDRVSGRECALKLLHPALRQASAAFAAFQELERTVAALATDAIARTSDFGLDAQLGQHFVVGELIGFSSIAELVRKHGRVHFPVFAEAFGVLASSLDAAFDKGIVHGDLKPQNLFFALERPGWARISDFGMAALRAACRPEANPAPLGWASPERLRGAPASRPDDIYALGLVAFFALTGRHYCRAMWEQSPDAAIVLRELDSANSSAVLHARSLGAELPDFVDSWFARTFARDKEQRFGSAHEAARALAELTHKDTALTPGIAAAVAAPLLFQSLPAREPIEKPALSPAFVPAEPRESSELPRSSRPPTVTAPRPKAREHVDGLPNAPPIALIAGAAVLVLTLAVLGVYAAYRLFTRSPNPTAAASAEPNAEAAPRASQPTPPSASAVATRSDGTAHFSCTPESCEWIVCDGEKLKTGVTELALPPGRHSCSASRYGFRTAVVEFTLEANKTTNVVFELLATKAHAAPRTAPKARPTKTKTQVKPAASSKTRR